jgi:hypothetical protein
MLNPRKRQIQGVLKNETWINTFILVKYKIFYSCMEFKIASNIIKGEWLYIHKNGQITNRSHRQLEQKWFNWLQQSKEVFSFKLYNQSIHACIYMHIYSKYMHKIRFN